MTEQLRLKIEALVPKMEGWCVCDKALAMAQLILDTKPKIVVELGVFGGRSMLPQALALRETGQGRIYGVDPMEVGPAIEGEIGEANAQWWLKDCPLNVIHEGAMQALWKENLEPWFIYIRSTAEHAAHLFKDIDILHFDQNHSELSSMRDIQIYYPLVRPGGYIWFDDTNWTTTHKAQEWIDAQGAKSIKDLATEDGTQTCRLYQKPEVVRERPIEEKPQPKSYTKRNVGKIKEPVLQES
jgi:predicted O-methyltransferase YrrM